MCAVFFIVARADSFLVFPLVVRPDFHFPGGSPGGVRRNLLIEFPLNNIHNLSCRGDKICNLAGNRRNRWGRSLTDKMAVFDLA